jgi:hypothetical protein
MKKLEDIFNYEYAGGGYFREKGIKKGDTATDSGQIHDAQL